MNTQNTLHPKAQMRWRSLKQRKATYYKIVFPQPSGNFILHTVWNVRVTQYNEWLQAERPWNQGSILLVELLQLT
jgi:hypothetical protein